MNLSKVLNVFNLKRMFVAKKATEYLDTQYDMLDVLFPIIIKRQRELSKKVVTEVIATGDADKIIAGAELLMEGLKSVDWKAIAFSIQQDMKEAAEEFAANKSVQQAEADAGSAISELSAAFNGETVKDE